MTTRDLDIDAGPRSRSDELKRRAITLWKGVVAVTPVLVAVLAFLAQVGWWPFDDYVRKDPVRIDLASSIFNAPGYDDPAREYVCLVNRSGASVDLTGWVLRDAERVVNVLPRFTLEADAAVRVHPGVGADSRSDLFGSGSV